MIQGIHLNEQFDLWLTVFYAIKCILEVVNTIVLLRDAAKWMKKSRIAKSLGDVNRYKECTLHSVKYTLSGLILSAEVVLFILNVICWLEYQRFEKSANEYFHTIVSDNCSIYNSQTMVCAAYLGALCLSPEALTPVLISAILSTMVILINFLTTAYNRSEIDTDSIKNSFHRMFWRSLIIFTLISLQVTYIIGIVTAYTFIFYQVLFQARKTFVNFYHVLVAKGNDPGNNAVDRRYFKIQAQVYKRGVWLVFISVVPLLTSLSLFFILKKGIFELLSKPCWVEYLYLIKIPRDIPQALGPAINLICEVISIAERLSLLVWIVASIPLNLLIQVRYVKDYVKRNRLFGRHQYRFPGHKFRT